MLRIFTPVKIQRLRPSLNPPTWVPEASMLATRPPKPSMEKSNIAWVGPTWRDERPTLLFKFALKKALKAMKHSV